MKLLPPPSHLVLFLLGSVSTFAATNPADLTAARELLAARKFAEAEAAARRLVAAEPQDADVRILLSQALLGTDRWEDAVKELEKGVAAQPTSARLQLALGDVYGQAAQKAGMLSKFGLAKKCLAAYQRAAELEPNNLNAHQSLFEYYRRAPGIAGGGADKALAEAAIIAKLDPVRGHSAYISYYLGEKQYDQALARAEELKKIDATRGRLALASIYAEKKEFDRAFGEFEEALKQTPDDYGALYQIGRLAATSGQQADRGLATLRRCLELTPGKDQPSHAAAQWRIGQLLEAKKDSAGARTAYEAAVRLDPKFAPAADSLKKLK